MSGPTAARELLQLDAGEMSVGRPGLWGGGGPAGPPPPPGGAPRPPGGPAGAGRGGGGGGGRPQPDGGDDDGLLAGQLRLQQPQRGDDQRPGPHLPPLHEEQGQDEGRPGPQRLPPRSPQAGHQVRLRAETAGRGGVRLPRTHAVSNGGERTVLDSGKEREVYWNPTVVCFRDIICIFPTWRL